MSPPCDPTQCPEHALLRESYTDFKKRFETVEKDIRTVRDFMSNLKGMGLLLVFLVSLIGATVGAIAGVKTALTIQPSPQKEGDHVYPQNRPGIVR